MKKKWKKLQQQKSKENNRKHKPKTLYGAEVIKGNEAQEVLDNQMKGVSFSFIQSAGSCQSGYLDFESEPAKPVKKDKEKVRAWNIKKLESNIKLYKRLKKEKDTEAYDDKIISWEKELNNLKGGSLK